MANETIESDNKYAKKYMQQFHNGMTIDEVRCILLKVKKQVVFYNNCIKDFQYPMTPCADGYNLIITIKLPGFDQSLGKGDLQMYFYFDSNQLLLENLHELYYPAQH
ncbi:hypothetical protein EBB_09945 [Methylomonas sp. EbB]|uniref:Uncharacterized protein n=1 Tax=Methylomonas fluvii TaxID=1854564 RepID=A0ABR9DG21_9GAMM|nr:hypothetical protein [Methylomonas fluvii]